jgi:homopolymeric O-antigen transport system permease protein
METKNWYGYTSIAISDLKLSLSSWRLWSQLGWQDLLSRYRRSWAGPAWIFLTAAVFVGALSLVYSALFGMDLGEYIPIVAIGLVVWNFVTGTTGESVMVFVESEAYIRQTRLNLFVYIFRLIWRNVLIFMNQFTIPLFVIIVFDVFSFQTFPLAILGIFIMFFQAIWVVPLLGVLGTRFRDLQPMIQSILLIFFLVTPIFWPASLLGSRRIIADINPLSHLITIIREPLMGNVPPLTSYAVVGAVTIIGLILSGITYGRFKNRIVYWL